MVGPPNALRGYLSSIIKPSQKKQLLQFYSGQNEKEFPLNFTKKTIYTNYRVLNKFDTCVGLEPY